jgi:hypothetical protein
VREEALARLGNGDAAMSPLEKEHSEIFFQLLDALAEAGLTDAKRSGRMPEIEMLSDGRRLHQRHERDTVS